MEAQPIGESDWVEAAVGDRAAQVLRRYSVPCLHHAHTQALYRHRLATWTNATTYGTDRFHCLCSTFGAVAEKFLRGCNVKRPSDGFGSPFLIEHQGSAIYTWRYGDTAQDSFEGLAPEESWIRRRLLDTGDPRQAMLDYPGLPPIDLKRVVFLAWAGNMDEGLTKAFLGRPYLTGEGLVGWIDGAREDLDLDVGRETFVLPRTSTEEPPARHLLGPVKSPFASSPPAFSLELVDPSLKLDDIAEGDENPGGDLAG
ncbi:hypothetical protein [Frankia sp. CiP3]|uniref:hypothetical protein n=1 Tax=Frankia sp. CiP3 TaxID=2880971 RepID=UPI001EF53461|nr:hypothetical protein [Frankia sp. CiP3]